MVCGIGGDAPVQWLASVGVRFVDKPHQYQRGPTDLLVESLVGDCEEMPAGGDGEAAPVVDLAGRRRATAAARRSWGVSGAINR